MRIEERIAALTADVRPVRPGAVARRLSFAAVAGTLVSLAAVLVLYGLRPDLSTAIAGFSFWMKAAFTASVAILAFFALDRAARPEASVSTRLLIAAVPFGAILVAGGVELVLTPAPARAQMWLGDTWLGCPFSIAALSLPPLALLIVALRGLAPGHAGGAGFVAGLLAGGLAATAYALHCPERSAAFVATWNVLGILASGGLGALIGRRALRW